MAGAKDIVKTLVMLLGLSGFIVSANRETSILILGAGPAGLRAAEQLLEEGITDFIILESSDQIGRPMVFYCFVLKRSQS